MNATHLASDVLASVGGAQNVVANTLCMTRLRVRLLDPTLVNRKALCAADGVLGCADFGTNGIEIVLGPTGMPGVYDAFSTMTGIHTSRHTLVGNAQTAGNFCVHIATPTHTDAHPDAAADAAMLDQLSTLLDEDVSFSVPHVVAAQEEAPVAHGRRALVINGPNINLVGIREPSTYGSDSFASLIRHCKEAAAIAGFDVCRCFQSNHEGDLVDAIQHALGRFDGIVINPGAYTHTSIALLDALLAVCIPAVEVHISNVSTREEFRQISYLRKACIATICGEGIAGYGHAIRVLAAHLGMGSSANDA